MFRFRSRARKVVLLCLAAAGLRAHAANSPPVPDHPHYAIQHFGERFGLGSATVLTMAQDPQGFLWIGTQTGLFRYDGNGVTRFGRGDGLPGELVELILAAPDGKLWIRARKGIAYRVGERFQPIVIPTEAGTLHDSYQSFTVDSAGTLFASSQNGLLRVPRGPQQAQIIPYGSNALPAAVDALVRTDDDTVWFASGRQIGRIRPGSSSPEVFVSLDWDEDHVIALLPAPQSRLWVRTANRLGLLNLNHPAAGIWWVTSELPGANNMGGPSLDRNNEILLPTSQGLYWRSGSSWRRIDHKSGLTSSAIASAFEDREGGIWIGTTGAGLDYWPGSKQWSGWTDAEGLPDALVLGVVRDSRQRLWVATNTALAVWDPVDGQWRTWAVDGARGGVLQLKFTPDGAVWALFPESGIYRFDANLAQPRGELVPAPAGWKPARIAAAPDSAIWADGADMLHVIRYDRGRFNVQENPAPPENAGTTRNVAVSPGGVVWSSGANGVSRLIRGHWQHFRQRDGLLADQVIDLTAVRDDEAWLGYADEGQMSRLRVMGDGNADLLHVKKGMCALGMDDRHRVWAEMEDGVGMISPDGRVRTFTQSDGLIWNDVNCNSLWQEPGGSVLFGTSKGLARYDSNQEESTPGKPSVVLTAAWFGKVEHLAEKSPRIPYNDSTFLARFATPVFHDDRITCRYRLDGLERDFTETSLREARYSSLPAGDYTFRVVCGSAESGQSNLASYSFTVLAPWWVTWWARGAGLVFAALAIWGVMWSQKERDRREKERLECAVAERSAELAQANRELQQASLSDPLTGVRNRRFFQSTILADASQAARAYRDGSGHFSRDHRDLIFFLIDIDHFKEVNDQHGHDAGDHMLVEIARRLNCVVRESDFLIRWGGEEFLVVCRSAERDDAPLMAGRILRSIGGEQFDLGNDRQMVRTCSVGWAPLPWMPLGEAELSVDEVLRLADRGLYLAKERGRNRAVGLVPSVNRPTDSGCYTRLEQLLEGNLIREIPTSGERAAAAASD
ncbi:MAG TPA: diguanylate cyclase [Terriglobales bacterium]|nr:diguanylate cyclase [Terriglobales bacterium]